MTIGAVVQARMASGRLPGKVVRDLRGKPVLRYLLERLERSATLDAVAVATSTDAADDAIETLCSELGVTCFRGSPSDVASRFRIVSERERFSGFVRVSGDSPLLDQRLVDRAVKLFRTGGFDLVTNVLPRTFPSGQSVEVVDTEVFAEVYEQLEDEDDLEHVTTFIYRHRGRFRIGTLESETPYHGVRLAVDTEEDLRRVAAVLALMQRPHWEYGVDDLVALYHEAAS